MPLAIRCVCCGRLCGHGKDHDAKPYKNGRCCDECYVKYVVPAIERQEYLKKRKYYSE